MSVPHERKELAKRPFWREVFDMRFPFCRGLEESEHTGCEWIFSPTMRCCQPLDVYGVASAPVWAVAELGRWDFTEGILDRTRVDLL